MTNKYGESYVARLLITSLLILSSSVYVHKVAGQSSSTNAEFERRLAAIMRRAASQHRRSLTYNPILARIARQKAYDMGQRNYFDHVNPDGLGPNYLVTQAGYVLPDFYGKRRSSNNIESIVAGNATPEEAWDNWMDSTGHRTHLLGLTEFYAEQTEYGVGYAFVPDSRYKHYWVVITAKPGESDSSSPPNLSDSTSNVRGGSASSYPNVIRGSNGKLRPASGYVWVDGDDPKDFRVKLMPGLIKTENGNFRPARGYRWVNPCDPKDFRVEPIP
ncbi:MAG TPA: CAP domain-containing protein [Nitrososphaera sp.]|nr:CAP domain-containing protein [Nitrososphaera sp.]